jgi:predicted nucleotidyltransferase
MNPSVRQNLLEVSYQFIESLDSDIIIEDIIVVGSIANFNWSIYSDIDVHILVDFKQYQKELKNMYVEYFDLKKIVFNQKRNIKMFGFDVEVFIEDVDMKGISGGVYSILEDKWIEKPKKIEPKIDLNLVKTKARQWMKMIDTYVSNLENEDIETIEKTFSQYKNKLKKFRLSGLKKGGEMSLENLVFKVLRRNGYIDKLYKSPLRQIDDKLSIK